ncbi:hypothetical protein GCM10022261_10270 [Brevibacterium daeguense]|uniref:YtxH domain-containing protein n=1 Tax=Brevibacterium daeguense TaxID=909936 RepID=A0ABP8EHR3_9MICO|nr:hypothetical protein [Brevibacterium daeguense]
MKKRLILLAGIGAGFVLGSRAGRQSYEKLKSQVEEWWSDPRVQDSIHKATDTVKEQAPAVAGKVQSAAGSAAGTVQGKVEDFKAGREQKKAEKAGDDADEAAESAPSEEDAKAALGVDVTEADLTGADDRPITLDDVENEDELILDDSISQPRTGPVDAGPGAERD